MGRQACNPKITAGTQGAEAEGAGKWDESVGGEQGVLVLKRGSKGFDEVTDDLVNYLFTFVQMNRRQRIELRNRVERLSEMFDWSVLIRQYHEAHNLALERTAAARPGKIEVRMV